MSLDLDALARDGATGELELELERELGELAGPGPAPRPAPALTQRVTVILEDGTEYAATLDARDRRAYAIHAERYSLPRFAMDPKNPDLLLLELLTVFSAWWATRHRLKLHGLDWPAFSAQVIDVTVDAGENRDPVPYPPERGDG